MNKSDLIEITRRYGLHPNKKLGQNFLLGDEIIEKIMKAAGVTEADDVLEIGPGLGALTERLVGRARSVTAVEIDSGFVRYLRERFGENGRFTLLHGDFLRMELPGPFTKAVSNLPYYCSSEILFRLAVSRAVPEIFVMLQKEMAERITSPPGIKGYGALTATLGLYCEPKILFKIERRCFYPQPDVTSSFMRLGVKTDTGLTPAETGLFHKIVKAAFWGRRKMLATSMAQSPHIAVEREVLLSLLRGMGLDEKIRGESLSSAQFAHLARSLTKYFNEKN